MKKIALPDSLPKDTIGLDPIRGSDYTYPTRDDMELHTLTDNSTSEDKQVNILPLSFDFKYELAGKISEEAALLFLEEMTRSSIAPDACKETISFIPE